MPAAVPVIAAAITKAAVMKFVATVAISLALGAYQQSRARKKSREAERAQRDAYNSSLKDRHITVRSGVSTRKYVLGTVRVGGTLMHIESNGRHNTALDSVLALAANRCSLVGYYIGDEYVAAANFPGSKWGKRKHVSRHHSHAIQPGSNTASVNLNEQIVPGSVRLVGWYDPDSSLHLGAPRVTGTVVEFDYSSNQHGRISIAYSTYEAEKIRAIFKDGDINQEGSSWPDVATPLWTAQHRLRGVSYLRTLNLWDEDLYHAGAPQMSAVVRGGWVGGYRFFDPRTNTYPAYTTNPAILAAWYMILPRSLGGMGIPESWVDWPYVSIAASICDEQIRVRTLSGQGYENIKRYECHTLLDTGNPPVDNLNIILSSMAGEYVFTAGRYRIFAGAFRTATITITDDDVAGDKDILMDKSGQDDAPANIITSTFINASRNWLESSPRPIRNEVYIASDGAESPLDLPLPASSDERQAAYLMGVALESARPTFAGKVTVLGIGEDIAVLDTVQLNLSNRPQYAGRTFQVINRIDYWDGTFELTLQEILSNIWSLDPDTFLPSEPTPIPDTSYLWNIAPIVGFTVSPQKPQSLANGVGVVRVDLSWERHQQPYVLQGGRIETRYRAPGEEWIWNPPVSGDAIGTSFTAALVDGVTYQYQARAVSGTGATSNWTDGWNEYDGVVLAPPALTGLYTESILSGINISWTYPRAKNALRHTRIRYGISREFDSSVHLGDYAWPTDRTTLLNLGVGAELFFWGRLVDANGTPGPWFPSETEPGIRGQASTDVDLILGELSESMVTSALGELIMSNIRQIPDIREGVDALGEDLNQLDQRVAEINAQVDELLGAAEWDAAQSYAVGTVVFADGKMYRAKQAVPAGTPVTSAEHWGLIGDYASISDGLIALAIQAQETLTRVEEAEGQITAVSEKTDTLASKVEDPENGLAALSLSVHQMRTQVTQLQDGLSTLSESTTQLSSKVGGLEEAQSALTNALDTLGTRVEQTEQGLMAESRRSTVLEARLLSDQDSDSLIPDYLMANPDCWFSHYGHNLTDRFVRTETGKVAPTVFRHGAGNSFNYSKTAIPTGTRYRVRFWVRRSVDSNGQFYITFRYVRPTGESVHADYGSLTVTPSVPADEQWHLVDEIVLPSDATFSRVQFGFSANHTSTEGWAEVQGFRVTAVIGTADINTAEVATAQSVSSLSSTVSQLDGKVTSQGTSLTSLSNTINDPQTGLQATADALNQTNTRLDGTEKAVVDQKNVLQAGLRQFYESEDAELDKALAVWESYAAIAETWQIVATEVSAMAEIVDIVRVSLGGDSAAVQETLQALAELEGKMIAQWGINVELNVAGVPYASGVSLGIVNEGGVTRSAFNVLANMFNVMHDVNGQPKAVFSVQGGAAIMNTALIGIASISSAHIESLDALKIEAQNLAAVLANIGTAYIDSAHMKQGSVKRLHVGVAEIDTLRIAGNAVTIIGQVFSPNEGIPNQTTRDTVISMSLPVASDLVITVTAGPSYSESHNRPEVRNMVTGQLVRQAWQEEGQALFYQFVVSAPAGLSRYGLRLRGGVRIGSQGGLWYPEASIKLEAFMR